MFSETTDKRPPSGEYVSSADEADKKLEAMGYTPVFKREFSAWSSFSFAMSISGVYPSLMSTWVYGLQAGGAAAITWSWILGGAGALVLSLSLAELASAYPSAGAMYSTLRFLAPAGHVPLLGWMTGWVNLAGSVAGIASTEYAASQMLLAAVAIASDFAYAPTAAHVVAVAALLTLAHACVNSLSTLWLNRLVSTYVVFHLGVLVAACVCLLVRAEHKNSLVYAFTDFQPSSGWSPPGFAFLFGCLTPAWIMTNADSAARIAEEAKNPSLVVPRAIANAATSTYAIGLVFNLILVVCMGSSRGGPQGLLASRAGNPVAQLFLDGTGRPAAVFFTLAGFVVMNMVAVSGLQSGSRALFALARDDLVPLARLWRRVARRSRTPVAAVWAYAALAAAANLLGLVSGPAIAAVFNVCAVALNSSYLLPIVCKMAYRRFEPGPWHLGRWSLPVNALAVAWNVFVSVIFFFPTQLPVTGENMNYAVVVFVFVLLFATAFWYTHGRHYYAGPGAMPRESQSPAGKSESA